MAKASKINFSSGENMDEDESGESGESGGGKKKMMIIIIVLLLLGIGAGAYFMMGSNDAEEVPADASPEEQMEAEINQSAQKSVIKLIDPIYTPPKTYTVNLRDGKHFLQIELVAVLQDEDALLFLAERIPIIDDMIIEFLQNLTTKELRKRSGMDLLKRELFKKVNSVYTQEFIDSSSNKDRTPVKKILVTKFILN